MTVQGGELNAQPADAFITLRAQFRRVVGRAGPGSGRLPHPQDRRRGLHPRGERAGAVGVITDRPQGEIYAPVVIICEGVNNILTQKLGLINRDLEPAQMALAFKKVISLPMETINARFGLAG